MPFTNFKVLCKTCGKQVTFDNVKHYGMTLRDYFAGQVIAGGMVSLEEHLPEEAAIQAYKIADAMLKARESDAN